MTETSEFKILIQKRGQTKSKLTRFQTFIDSFNASDRPNLTQLKLRLSKLEECWSEFENLQSNIELVDSSEIQLSEREPFESQYFNLSAQAQDLIDSLTKASLSSQANTLSTSVSTADRNQPNLGLPQVRLPTINLPTFAGNYEHWISFSDSFQSLIHKNEALSDIQRLHYLKSSLKGEAAQVIQSIELTSDNYIVAWELLEKRYKNLILIIQKHTRALFELPAVQRDSALCLRQLIDGVLSNLRALKALNQPTEHWDTLIVHLISSKLNQSTYKDWEMSRHNQPENLPTLTELIDFIQKRCHILETSYNNKTFNKIEHNTSNFKNHRTSCFTTQDQSCPICKGTHAIFQCQVFLKATPTERSQKLKASGLCFNCLKPGHRTNQCRSGNCRKCNGKHNTLLHFSADEPSSVRTAEAAQSNGNQNKLQGKSQHSLPEARSADTPTHSFTSTTMKHSSQILLSTAQVDVVGTQGTVMRCRALLDNGSQSCLMTERVAQHLKLARKTVPGLQISGIDQSIVRVNCTTDATIKSCVSNYHQTLQFLVVTNITGDLPSTSIDISNMKIPNNIILSDPNYHKRGKIDLLLGQEIFFDLLCIGQIKPPGCPTLQKTKLGWIVGGRIDVDNSNRPITTFQCNLTTAERIDRQLQTFWTLEELSKEQTHLTLEEKTCEEHFMQNTRRTEEGRYIVKMPLTSDANQELGESKDTAMKRFLQVEKRLERSQHLRTEYNKFMDEYEKLGHMEKLSHINEDDNNRGYFIPHHPVINTHSTTTKVRVVFDASAKTTSGNSLNDIQLVGPTIQRDLFSILVVFRLHNYVMTADLEKMYRQILIDESQQELQKILWRSKPDEPIQIYKLKTVTYGTSSASYLSTRTLKQLATDEGETYPEAAKVLQRDFYVDDLITGCSTREKASELQSQLIALLSNGGFNLRKWNSNSDHLLANLSDDLLHLKPQELLRDQDSTVKTLGLWWDSTKDEFLFKYTPSQRENPNQVTKRTVLSDISRLYDPLGILSPIIIRSKILLQEMWRLNLTWDESLPMQLHTMWNNFVFCLKNLTFIRVPRQITLRSLNGKYDIHAFADSSERAYGAVVYLRHENDAGNIQVSLMCSKSRVAPLRTISLPRLELCAAVLLAELVKNVQKALEIKVNSVTYWADSSVALSWISGEPARWKTFVANRVAKIQTVTKSEEWKHISSEENPADLISRGTTTKNLIDSSLWWHGPSWLSSPKSTWPKGKPFEEIRSNGKPIPEEKQPRKVLTGIQENNIISRLLEHHSSLEKIRRIIAWSLRFIANLKCKQNSETKNRLKIEELQSAEKLIIKHVQGETFHQEIKDLRNNVSTSSSKILSLDPFIDECGLIRVGGRIKKSSLPYNRKHQILLPKNHRLTEMLVKEEHIRQLHCGPQALLYALRQKYWILNGREVVRKVTHHCLKCFKAKPKLHQQKMSDLPADRVNPTRPFLHCGVDYCGPFLIKTSKYRNAKLEKSYVAVFICLATKAIHLELVSNLTTGAFLAATKRFVSRRGMCASILSDNGKNFVGANRKLTELKAFFDSENENIIGVTAKEGIHWTFNPPYSPHTGGIWEAAVKSLKYHLVRVVGNASVTFEEFNTLLTEVEAVLNSRPLTPMSNHPNDLTCLSPAHFLVGDILTAIPEPSVMNTPENRLKSWQRIQRLYQHFWSRWSREYLNHLQTRSKWRKGAPSLKIGDLVLLKEDNTPPVTWPLGRIIAVHPGQDDLIRTVTIKTAKNVTTRNVHRLCLLPWQD